MSKKKVDVSFIKQVESAADWTNTVMKSTNQLLVIDVYAAAWGPSEMLDGHFSTVYYDLADKIAFSFVRAVANHVPILAEYLGASSSTFLFYLDGKQVAKVEGPKMSEIKAKIHEFSPVL